MRIVTDSGVDLPEALPEDWAEVHSVPLTVTLDGKTYREGIDIAPDDFYRLLEESDDLPITSQPSSGEFANLYRKLAQDDPDILSIHISSGLSGTLNSAKAAAESVPEARITFVDTKTLSAASAWQVEAAAKAIRLGWDLPRILAMVEQIREATNSIYTLRELKYLIHGGRIGHMKGLIASMLNIKPLIGIEKLRGTYVQMGQARTFGGALKGLSDLAAKLCTAGSEIRAQVMHAANPEGAEALKKHVDEMFHCFWQPTARLSLVLGAHTGPSLVAVAVAANDAFREKGLGDR